MKRIYAVLGALCALIMFHTNSAFAQGFDVYRYATANEMAKAGKVLAEKVDSVVVDYTEMDPLNIPGIQIIDQDTTVFSATEEIDGYFYIPEGHPFVTCVNPEARLRGVWILAPNTALLTDLAIGGEGNLTQFIGNGPDQGAVGPIFLNCNVDIYNTVTAGSGGTRILIGVTSGAIGPYSINIENTYVIESGNDVSIYGNSGISIVMQYKENTTIFMKNVHCYNNPKWDLFIRQINIGALEFLAINSDFLSEHPDYTYNKDTVFIYYTNTDALVEFVNCRFAPRIEAYIRGKTNITPSVTFLNLDETMFFYESRPSAFVDENLVTLWPRQTPLIQSDFDDNGVTGLEDVIYLAQDFGAGVDEVKYGRIYDSDGSSVVDMPDLEAVTRNYLSLPVDFRLQDATRDMFFALESLVVPLLEALPMYPAVEDALMEDPQFGPFFREFIATAILDEEASIPSKFALEQNYPNPFNAQTQIQFSIPESGFVELVVYDVLGRVVHTLVSEPLEAGTYTQTWDGRGSNDTPAATGVYMYVLSCSSGQRIAGKMVLAR